MPVLKEILSEAKEHLVWLRYARQAKDPNPLVTHVYLEWPLSPKVRYGHGFPRHEGMGKILDSYRPNYVEELKRIKSFESDFVKIAAHGKLESPEPWWVNGMLPAMDSAALYSFLASRKPKLYMEIGSGHSTRFARRAITDHRLPTKIVSLDPEPRSPIDGLCDEVIRKPIESVDLGLLERLTSGDILFVDSSHRCYQNSDVTVIFMEILPRLPKEIFIHFHDIYWPEDYPVECKGRFYNEQYLLAAHLLSESVSYEVLLPNYYVSTTILGKGIFDVSKDDDVLSQGGDVGTSFWMRKI